MEREIRNTDMDPTLSQNPKCLIMSNFILIPARISGSTNELTLGPKARRVQRSMQMYYPDG